MKEKKEDIISKLLINNYDKYYHIAYSYAQNKNDAQDIVQEGAYKAIYNSKKLRQVKYADTWICKIIINEAINYIKKNRFNWDRDIVSEMKDEKDEYDPGGPGCYDDCRWRPGPYRYRGGNRRPRLCTR